MSLILFVVGMLIFVSVIRGYQDYRECEKRGRKRDFLRKNLVKHFYWLMLALLGSSVFLVTLAVILELGFTL